jgi:hypothetical protein
LRIQRTQYPLGLWPLLFRNWLYTLLVVWIVLGVSHRKLDFTIKFLQVL